jgi:hypothetical protein
MWPPDELDLCVRHVGDAKPSRALAATDGNANAGTQLNFTCNGRGNPMPQARACRDRGRSRDAFDRKAGERAVWFLVFSSLFRNQSAWIITHKGTHDAYT